MKDNEELVNLFLRARGQNAINCYLYTSRIGIILHDLADYIRISVWPESTDSVSSNRLQITFLLDPQRVFYSL